MVGPLTMIMIVAMNIEPNLDNVSFMRVQLIALIAIVGIAWQWRAAQQVDVVPHKRGALTARSDNISKHLEL